MIEVAPERDAAARDDGIFRSRPMRRLRRNPLALLGLSLVLAYAVTALFAPLLAPVSGNCLRDLGGRAANLTEPGLWRAIIAPPATCFQIPRSSLTNEPLPPREGFPFGTIQGYDIRYGLVWGTRTALLFGLVVVGVNVFTGLALGLIAGYFGGAVDNLLMRFTDVVLAFPAVVLTIVLVGVLGQGITNVALSFALVGWCYYARLVRAEVLRVRRLEYVEAARALGSSQAASMLRHVLPNSIGGLLSIAVLDLGTIALSLGALSYLGLGTPPGFADWGQLVQLSQQWVQGPPGQPFAYWYVTVFPGLCIVVYSLGWNLVGDALQDAFGVNGR